MAAVTTRIAAFGNGATFSLTYDDTAQVLTGFSWTNPSGATFVIRATVGANSFSRTITPSNNGSVNLTKGQQNRFPFALITALNGSTELAPTFTVSIGG